MQIYRGMDIGTAKPSPDEQQQVKHYLIDVVNPDEDFSVAQFIQYCQNDIHKIEKKGKNVLIVGGTGLYLNALINGYTFPNIEKDEEFRKDAKAQAEAQGLQSLYQRLQRVDPDSAEKIHPNDEFRIIRALEIFELTGKPKSELATKGKSILPKEYKIIGLNMDREKLYERINQRVGQMFELGLIEEVMGLLAKGYSANLISLRALGYKEVIEHLNGDMSLQECVEKIKKGTRNFAKRQMTWFRSFENVEWNEVV